MSNLIQQKAPSIKIKKTIAESLSFQQTSCPAPPTCTPLGTPPGPNNTPPQSPQLGGRIQRSNSACNTELLPCRYTNKQTSKRRNTQLLQAADPQLDSNNVYYTHRLQTLRTIAAGAQKSSSLVSKGLLSNRCLSKDFKDSIDEDESNAVAPPNEMNNNQNHLSKNVLKDVLNESKQTDFVDNKLSDNLKKVNLAEQQDTSRNSSSKMTSEKLVPESNSVQNHLVRRFKSGQDLDELIKENKKNPNDLDNVNKIIATAEMRKNQLLLLLDEHQQIVQKIKLAEISK